MRHDHWTEPLPSRPDEHDHARSGPDNTSADARNRRVAVNATALITTALIVAILAAVL